MKYAIVLHHLFDSGTGAPCANLCRLHSDFILDTLSYCACITCYSVEHIGSPCARLRLEYIQGMKYAIVLHHLFDSGTGAPCANLCRLHSGFILDTLSYCACITCYSVEHIGSPCARLCIHRV